MTAARVRLVLAVLGAVAGVCLVVAGVAITFGDGVALIVAGVLLAAPALLVPLDARERTSKR